MDFSKLSRAEMIGVIASAILVLSLLFMDWYNLEEAPRVEGNAGWICGEGNLSCTGFQTFPILRWLLLGAAIAPPILAYIVVRGHKLSWAPGELTMVVGFAAFVLIAYNGIIDKPGTGEQEIGVSLAAGYWVALVAAGGIAAAGIGRATESGERVRKTPGTV
jgi:hypothetical protein